MLTELLAPLLSVMFSMCLLLIIEDKVSLSSMAPDIKFAMFKLSCSNVIKLLLKYSIKHYQNGVEVYFLFNTRSLFISDFIMPDVKLKVCF